jgi:hypothetical protein
MEETLVACKLHLSRMAFMNEQASGNKCVVRAPNSGKGDAETSKFLFASSF